MQPDKSLAHLPVYVTSSLRQPSCSSLWVSSALVLFSPCHVWIGIYIPLYGMRWEPGCRVSPGGSDTLCMEHLWGEGLDLSSHLLPTSFCKCTSCSYFWLPKHHTGNFLDFSPFAGVFGIFRHLAEGGVLQTCWLRAPQIIGRKRDEHTGGKCVVGVLIYPLELSVPPCRELQEEQTPFTSSYMLWMWVFASENKLTGMLHWFVYSFLW